MRSSLTVEWSGVLLFFYIVYAGDFLTTFYNYDQTSNSTDTLEYQLVIPKTRHAKSGNSSGSEIGDSSGSEFRRKMGIVCTAMTIILAMLFANA